MRIAQIIVPLDGTPSQRYDCDLIQVATQLTEALGHRGHEVGLWVLTGTHVHPPASAMPMAMNNPGTTEPRAGESWLPLSTLADQVDLLHFHVCDPPFELVETLMVPTLYTLYDTFNPQSYQRFVKYGNHNFISISDGQRQGGPALNYIRTIYSGVDLSAYAFNPQANDPQDLSIDAASDANAEAENAFEPALPPDPYLAFCGPISPRQGAHLAIQVAQRSGFPLKLAGKIDNCDRAFFETEIAPHLDGTGIDYWGPVDHFGQQTLLAHAYATLCPLTLNQPFTPVLLASMAVGTPIISTGLGAATEVIVPGKTGFICDSLDAMVEAVLKIKALNRQDCRDLMERHFGIPSMMERYEAAYGKVLDDWQVCQPCAYPSALAL